MARAAVHGANLDRVQIVKGWLEKNGRPQERVYDIILADCRSVARSQNPAVDCDGKPQNAW